MTYHMSDQSASCRSTESYGGVGMSYNQPGTGCINCEAPFKLGGRRWFDRDIRLSNRQLGVLKLFFLKVFQKAICNC